MNSTLRALAGVALLAVTVIVVVVVRFSLLDQPDSNVDRSAAPASTAAAPAPTTEPGPSPGPNRGAEASTAGDPQTLRPSAGATPVSGRSLCAADAGTTLLECAVFPLVNAEAIRCPALKADRDALDATGGADVIEGRDAGERGDGAMEPARCARPAPLDSGLIAFRLSEFRESVGDPPTPRLAVYRGGTQLTEVAAVTDAAKRWANVAVCPRDLDADGRTELVVLYHDAGTGTVLADFVEFPSAGGASVARSALVRIARAELVSCKALRFDREDGERTWQLDLTPST
ncbi:MAG: hypothetical protein OEY23_00840 [Acidimicrobiia bacterium]|nr:hypothetical protein [Acidimicrobiia bacterium]